jgi:hypothetical protein
MKDESPMEYRTEIKPLTAPPKNGEMIIHITDIKLHTSYKRPTVSIAQKLIQAFKNKLPDRIYAPIRVEKDNTSEENRKLVLELIKNDLQMLEILKEEQKNGRRVLLSLPKEGIPVFAGEDTIDFIASVKGQRILRRIAKGKPLGTL